MKNCRILLVSPTESKEIAGKITSLFKGECQVIEKKELSAIKPMVRNMLVKSVILVMEDGLNGCAHDLKHLSEDFPSLPMIAVIPNDLELARKCGEIGIWRTIDRNDILIIKEVFSQMYTEKFTLNDVGIIPDLQDCSNLLQKAMHMIEEDYTELHQVKQIAERLGVDECTLVREFRKFNLDTPKNILLGIKTYHASILMKNKGLTMKEISKLSGFANERQFQHTFRKKFEAAPADFRNKLWESTRRDL